MPARRSRKPVVSQQSQLSTRAKNSRGWRWSDDQTVFFLAHLLEARRTDDRFRSFGTAILRSVFMEFVKPFQETYPQDHWDTAVFENKFRILRNYWRLFREMHIPGTEYDEATGKLSMSDENKKRFIEKYGTTVNNVIKNGLNVKGEITYEAWTEIFSDDLPSGRMVVAGTDKEGFRRLERAEDEKTDPFTSGGSDDEGDEILALTPAQFRGSHTASKKAPVYSDLQIAVTRESTTCSRSSSVPQRGVKRRCLSPTPPNSGSIQSVRRKKVKTNSVLLKKLQTLFAGPSNICYRISSRVPGSDDLEKAVSGCVEEMTDRGTQACLRIVHWISQKPMNAVLWNCLDSKAMKWAWVDCNFGKDFE